MLDVHVTDKKALKKLQEISYRKIFDNILVGTNIISLSCINDIAVFVASLNVDKLHSVTFGDVIKAVGQYEDNSGRLV
ncbi:MAG: hypothetical protein Q8K36_06970 [Alphaproteobacteria bacterium]|nr:hypothetical protein [Alphaproteobacteria bacterium]